MRSAIIVGVTVGVGISLMLNGWIVVSSWLHRRALRNQKAHQRKCECGCGVSDDPIITVSALTDEQSRDLDNRLRMKLRRCKEILSNVRWDCGPPTEVQVIPASPGDDPPTGRNDPR